MFHRKPKHPEETALPGEVEKEKAAISRLKELKRQIRELDAEVRKISVEGGNGSPPASPPVQEVPPERLAEMFKMLVPSPSGKRTCPSCSRVMPASGPFCPLCGQSAPTPICARCEGLIFDVFEFCNRCGCKMDPVESMRATLAKATREVVEETRRSMNQHADDVREEARKLNELAKRS